VTVGDLDTAAMLTVSATNFTSIFYSALTAAQGGDGAPLRTLALQLVEDVDGASLVDPLWAITCNDTAIHPGPTAAGTQAKALAANYPLLGAYAVEYTMGGCVRWPAGRLPVTGIHPQGVPPILVIGNTGDPNTPFVGARHLAALIPGARLLTWDGWGHTWLLSGAGDTCMQRWVSTYLIGGGTPPPHTQCS
jgi:pimeloyl-ACP methyl ester carboxylesterase